jgi:hypothetical protein
MPDHAIIHPLAKPSRPNSRICSVDRSSILSVKWCVRVIRPHRGAAQCQRGIVPGFNSVPLSLSAFRPRILPLIANRRRWLSVSKTRFLPMCSLSTATSAWTSNGVHIIDLGWRWRRLSFGSMSGRLLCDISLHFHGGNTQKVVESSLRESDNELHCSPTSTRFLGLLYLGDLIMKQRV